ncbi:hypothetical protein B0H66DRAFT_562209 [Apodospora peruviana]|uniref:Uncharacterized protein n=1 Tax=Apodospora peruviana TaxID=516989 RepID=A0AAE0I1D6_9PEZI|nr:hypothetical protein B0H66DRAFT_562209 [Apodospora peruviana]
MDQLLTYYKAHGPVALSDVPAVLRNLTWKDFDPSSNCEWTGKVFGQLYRWGNNGVGMLGMSTYLMAEFARATAPVSLANVTGVQIADWDAYVYQTTNITLYYLGYAIMPAECKQECCRNLKWEGNPDLAGIGVYAAYIIQATLTAFFFLVCAYIDVRAYCRWLWVVWRWEREHKTQPKRSEIFQILKDKYPPNPRTASLRARFDRCLNAFWISSFYFALCTFIAAITITVAENTEANTALYSSFGAQFSGAVIGSLWPWYRNKSQRYHLVTFCLWLMVLSMAVVFVTFKVALYVPGDDDRPSYIFEANCLSNVELETFSDILTLVVWIMCLILAFTVLVLGILTVWRAYSRRGPRRHLFLHMRWFVSLFSFGVLWYSFVSFVQVRSTMASFVDEDYYTENEWGFGQILAVVAWLPMFVEFFRVWACTLTNTSYLGKNLYDANPMLCLLQGMRWRQHLCPGFGNSFSFERPIQAARADCPQRCKIRRLYV